MNLNNAKAAGAYGLSVNDNELNESKRCGAINYVIHAELQSLLACLHWLRRFGLRMKREMLRMIPDLADESF
jgi:hypothetical protein